jgi:hypothetical protein
MRWKKVRSRFAGMETCCDMAMLVLMRQYRGLRATAASQRQPWSSAARLLGHSEKASDRLIQPYFERTLHVRWGDQMKRRSGDFTGVQTAYRYPVIYQANGPFDQHATITLSIDFCSKLHLEPLASQQSLTVEVEYHWYCGQCQTDEAQKAIAPTPKEMAKSARSWIY